MTRRRFLWLGIHLSVVGGVLIFLGQASAASWRVEASCEGEASVSGFITAESGSHTIEVVVTYHVPGDGVWHKVPGAVQTLNVEGTGPHRFGPLDVSATPSEANAIRVEIDVTGDPTKEKSDSFKPCGSAPTNTSTPQPTDTSTAKPTGSSPTQPVSTSTQPAKTSTARPTHTSTPRPTNTSTPRPTNTSTPRPTTISTPRPTNTSTPSPTSTATALATAPFGVVQSPTATPISEVRGTVTTATSSPTPTPMLLGPPASGSGGLLAAHRTSLTVFGLGLLVLGVALIGARGLVDDRQA